MLIAWGRSGRGGAPAYKRRHSFAINSIPSSIFSAHCVSTLPDRWRPIIAFVPLMDGVNFDWTFSLMGARPSALRIEPTVEKWLLLTCWHGRRYPFFLAWLVRPGEATSLAVERSSHKSREGKWWRLTRHFSWINEDVAHEKDKDCRRAVSSGPPKLTP